MKNYLESDFYQQQLEEEQASDIAYEEYLQSVQDRIANDEQLSQNLEAIKIIIKKLRAK
jgi:hypothetical protein